MKRDVGEYVQSSRRLACRGGVGKGKPVPDGFIFQADLFVGCISSCAAGVFEVIPPGD